MTSHSHHHGGDAVDQAVENARINRGEGETEYRLHRRFDRLGRLYGDGAVALLMRQRVVVVGLGGVGSFAAEALARSAIGHLMLVDFDDVCVTNSNRQLQALAGNVGKPKAWVLRDRLRLINPQAKVEAKRAFYNDKKSDEILQAPAEWGGGAVDWVVDCIDNMTAKAHLLATCKARGIPVVSSMGAAGKLDPTRLRVADLADTYVDPMAREMRKILRSKYGFPKQGDMGITAVYSDEKRTWPRELTYDHGEGFACVCPKGDELVQDVRENSHACDERTLIDGTAVFVTGAFGLACASAVVNRATEALRATAAPAKAKQGTMQKGQQPHAAAPQESSDV